MKALTQAEFESLLASTEDLRLRTMCLVAFRHGMRASEVTGLRRADVDLTARTVVVRRLKNSLTTVQPLAECEVEALAELLRTNIASDYVFPSNRTREKGKAGRMSRITFGRLFKSACKAAGLAEEKAHPHALKHGLAFALVAANVTLPLIQRALGHRSISSTAVYTMPTDEMAGAAIERALGE